MSRSVCIVSCDSWLCFLINQCSKELLLEIALNASRNATFAKLSFSMNTSTSLKSFHVILCKLKYSRLRFSGTFLFTNLPAINNALIDTDCANTDGGAAIFLKPVNLRSLLMALKNY